MNRNRQPLSFFIEQDLLRAATIGPVTSTSWPFFEGLSSVEKMIAQLTSGEPEERQQAAFELGQTENQSAVPHLIAALEDPDLHVRVYAIQGLCDIPAKSAVEPLCQVLVSNLNEPLIVSNVCATLGEIRDSASVPTLVNLLASPDPFTRYDAAQALGEVGDSTAIPALEALFSDETMPEREGDDGDLIATLYSIGEQAKRAVEMIRGQT